MKFMLNAKKFVRALSDYNNRRYDCSDYHQKTVELPRTLDTTDCKNAIRHLNGTDNPQLNALIIATLLGSLMISTNNAFFEQNNLLLE